MMCLRANQKEWPVIFAVAWKQQDFSRSLAVIFTVRMETVQDKDVASCSEWVSGFLTAHQHITVGDKMGFFDKTNNSMITNAFKELSDRRDCEIFFTNVPQVGIFNYYVVHC